MPRHEYLYGQTLPQLEALCNRLEMPRFAAKQIARWLYDKHATTIEAMSDLSARHRALLAETYEVGLTAPEKVSISTDGTKKYLYRTSQNHFIESAYIPGRRPGDALHLVAGGLPYGLPFLRNRTTGAPALPFDERNPQPDRVAARTGTAHQRRFHGHGRTARQPGQSAAGRSKSSLRRGDSAGRPHESRFRPPV